MAGIYIHIPFCKQACHYCDFHFSTQLGQQAQLVESICNEIELQKNYLQGESVETIYFGGGTPSLLLESELAKIMNAVYKYHEVAANPEITLEANPDDLSKDKIYQLKHLNINRLSIGIQTFHDDFLQWMNRAHNASEAMSSVLVAQEAGIENITIDLIYGIPSLNHDKWRDDLKKAIELGVRHISAYNLTIEPKTAFGKWKKNGRLEEPNDEFSERQFEMLIETLTGSGFIHYEISNFGKENWFSKHNSSYWKGVKYLGIGPSAHSYNGVDRQYNVSNNLLYVKSIGGGRLPSTIETLTETERANEYILISLRTIWGLNLDKLYDFKDLDFRYFKKAFEKYKNSGHLIESADTVTLSQNGKFIADKITRDLFF